MANTSLPTSISDGSTGLISHANTVHGEVNELSRNTGLREIKSLLVNGWTATSVYIERVRDRVHLYVRGLDGTGAASNAFLTFGDASGQIPTGFRALGNSYQSELQEDANGNSCRLRVDANSVLGPAGVNVGGYNREFAWRCTASFPDASTWPGTAV